MRRYMQQERKVSRKQNKQNSKKNQQKTKSRGDKSGQISGTISGREILFSKQLKISKQEISYGEIFFHYRDIPLSVSFCRFLLPRNPFLDFLSRFRSPRKILFSESEKTCPKHASRAEGPNPNIRRIPPRAAVYSGLSAELKKRLYREGAA